VKVYETVCLAGVQKLTFRSTGIFVTITAGHGDRMAEPREQAAGLELGRNFEQEDCQYSSDI
jgi:hypothetical protein